MTLAGDLKILELKLTGRLRAIQYVSVVVSLEDNVHLVKGEVK